MKKLLFTFSILLATFCIYHNAHAASIQFAHAPTRIDQQQQFYVDVTIDPQGETFNAIQTSIVFSDDTLSFVRAETGTSNVTLFIQPPTVKGNTITLSGIIPGGFNELINPFDPKNTLPGQIVRLVFAGKAAGEGQIIATGTTIADNDGRGTLTAVPDQQLFLSVSTSVTPSVYKTPDTQPPTLNASLIQENNLYNGKYTVVFDAIDKQSGIDRVEIKEGNNEWKAIQSPYILRDQSRNSILLMRAFDSAGNVSDIITIAPIARSTSTFVPIVILVILVMSLVYVFYKKKKQPTL